MASPHAESKTPGRRRVLFIASQPYFKWRGSPIRVGFDVQALAELGMDVDLLVLPFGEDRSIPGVRIHRAPNLFNAKSISIGPSLLKALFDVVLFFKAWGMIRTTKYDVLHCVEDAGAIGVPLARRARAALVFEKHSDPGSYRKNVLRNMVMGVYSRVEAFVIRHADAVIGTGPALAEQARQADWGTNVYHIPDIPSSLAEATPEGVRRMRERLATGPNDVLVAYVGSFAMYQGIDLLFDSIPATRRRCPSARFVIVGGSEQEIEVRRKRLRDEGVEDAAVFLGKVPPDRLPDILAACDVLLSPRIAGANTPLKLLDYLKAGRAILATDNAANRQILDESTALFVQPDCAAFADGICRLAGDSSLRDRLAAGGGALIESTYNFREFKRCLAGVYAVLHALEGGDALTPPVPPEVRKRGWE